MIAFPFHWDSKAYGSDQVFVGPNGTSSLQMNFYTKPYEKGWGREERVRRGTTKIVCTAQTQTAGKRHPTAIHLSV
jgi:hypothetical protein